MLLCDKARKDFLDARGDYWVFMLDFWWSMLDFGVSMSGFYVRRLDVEAAFVFQFFAMKNRKKIPEEFFWGIPGTKENRKRSSMIGTTSHKRDPG